MPLSHFSGDPREDSDALLVRLPLPPTRGVDALLLLLTLEAETDLRLLLLAGVTVVESVTSTLEALDAAIRLEDLSGVGGAVLSEFLLLLDVLVEGVEVTLDADTDFPRFVAELGSVAGSSIF